MGYCCTKLFSPTSSARNIHLITLHDSHKHFVPVLYCDVQLILISHLSAPTSSARNIHLITLHDSHKHFVPVLYCDVQLILISHLSAPEVGETVKTLY
jgi:hypothetical protein